MQFIVTAYIGSANTNIIKVKPDKSGDLSGLDMVGDYLDMSGNFIERVVFAVGSESISTDTDSIRIENGHLKVEFGDLAWPSGESTVDDGVLYMFITGQPDPIVLAGQGMPVEILANVFTIPPAS